MTNLNELQIFTVIAQEMSFIRAGVALGISKAAVSRALASLESRLSIRLFERTTRRLALTEAGETYLAHAKRAMEEADDAEAAVSKLSAQPRGTLRVIMPVTMARSSVGPNLAGFLRAYPELRIEITLRGGRLDPIAERADVVFQTSRPETDSQIIQRRMSTVSVGIYASKQYLATAPPLRSPQDLTKHSCITMATARGGATWNLYKDGKTQEVRLRGRVSVGDPMVHHQLCRAGVGVAAIPEWEVREDVKKKYLQRVLPAWTPSPIEVYVLYPTRLSMTPKLHAFLRFMDDVINPAQAHSPEK